MGAPDWFCQCICTVLTSLTPCFSPSASWEAAVQLTQKLGEQWLVPFHIICYCMKGVFLGGRGLIWAHIPPPLLLLHCSWVNAWARASLALISTNAVASSSLNLYGWEGIGWGSPNPLAHLCPLNHDEYISHHHLSSVKLMFHWVGSLVHNSSEMFGCFRALLCIGRGVLMKTPRG